MTTLTGPFLAIDHHQKLAFFVLFVSICRLNSFPRTEHSKFKIYFFTSQQRWKCSTRGAKKILAKVVEWPDLGSTATHRSQPVPQERGGAAWEEDKDKDKSGKQIDRQPLEINTSAYSRTLRIKASVEEMPSALHRISLHKGNVPFAKGTGAYSHIQPLTPSRPHAW